MTENNELREIARTLATTYAAKAAQLRADGVKVAATKSSISDVVTQADRTIESEIRAELARLRPDDTIVGEEDGGEAGEGITWIIDPIDGTVNYLYGGMPCGVSIAACRGADIADLDVLAGAVAEIGSNRVWHAAKGEGAIGPHGALAVSEVEDLEVSLVATGFSYVPRERVHQARVLSNLIGRVRDIRRMGACSIDLCMVAEGQLDLYYEMGLGVWDMAAGKLIVEEAGGTVTTFDWSHGSQMTLAGHPEIAASFRALLRKSNSDLPGRI